MAKVIRSPKSGSDWSYNELIAYNITVTTQSPEDFFRQNPMPPLDNIDPSFIDSDVHAENVPDATWQYLAHLDVATTATQKTFVDEFCRETLRILGFAERGLFLTIRFTIPLTICGNARHAQTDVCLLDRGSMVLLILQGDKVVVDAPPPEPQVIAEAIAAYQYNNIQRQTRGLPALEAMTIPCIMMVGTRPTFYLVPVTRALSDAVMTGLYPETPTMVMKCVTSLGHTRRISEGMETPEFRRVAFQRFVAFKNLAKEFWGTFIH